MNTIKNQFQRIFTLAFLFLLMVNASLFALDKVRVAVLKFGTVNWELKTIKDNGFDKVAGFELEIIKMANLQATRIALLNGAADFAVADWIWVSQNRADGRHYSFIPYSSGIGALMVNPDAGIDRVEDLKGKKLGIAGGALSKGWLLLQALVKNKYNADLNDWVEKSFAAPPLLNRELLKGRLDAVITFWHFSAKLEGANMKRLIDFTDILDALGVKSRIPMLGYVFKESWANANPKLIRGFAAASKNAKALLAENPKAWNNIKKLMKAKNNKTFENLRDGFIAGIPTSVTPDMIKEANTLYGILGKYGGKKFTKNHDSITPGTFWTK